MADPHSSGTRIVVVLSGGMDSCVCATLAVSEFGAAHVAALHMSYGQRTESRELQAFHAICDRLKISRRMVLRSEIFRAIGGSALTDASIAVPASQAIGKDIPVTYVPFRNAHFLAAAVSWAETLNAEQVSIGAVEQDSSGYPDCRPAFYEAFNRAVALGTKAGTIRVVTPLIALRKAEIIRRGLESNAPLELTWSCYGESEQACGSCDSCVLRVRAFADAGANDPLPYRVGLCDEARAASR